ncbi:glutathione binding-like protein [Luteimonas sp. S4-F44]|uniref:glutathione S-transferase family protein n=1 Tax=Luteimonas sp. S4-F44 TaxID=2925842 RepID=UPI001F52FF9A|nr:glutathione binding-like protein [Luteimonas sp. S4-F44]UNK41051.1 glutathione binding-like protein [Luteimonas sp. S4-F44]
MIELYAADTANSSKIILALEEASLSYSVIPIDILAGEQFGPVLTKLNPNSKVPVIVDTNGYGGRPHTVFESGAILLYLADKSGLLMPTRLDARSEAIQWLMLQLSTLGPMMGQLIHFARFAPPGNDYALSRYRSQVRRVLDVLEDRLRNRDWIVGEEYSVVDIANFPWVRSIRMFLGEEIDAAYPQLTAWTARIAARPAVTRSDLAKAELTKSLTKPEEVDPDKMDLLLGRGAYSRD